MKNLSILIIAIMVCTAGYAQRHPATTAEPLNSYNPYQHLFSRSGATARTTEIGDTLILRNMPDTASLVLYTATAGSNDSGYVTGTNYLLDQGFAEHYYINGDDSSLEVIGVFAQFGGYVSDTSTQTISLNIWDESPLVVITDSLAYSGFPADGLDTLSVPFSQLGIGPAVDTMKLFLFAVPTPITTPFFAGYTINNNYTFSDSNNIGLAGTIDSLPYNDFSLDTNIQTFVDTFYDNEGDTTVSSIATETDTTENVIINVRNATMKSDYNWYDNLTQNDSLRNHLAIFPVVAILGPTGVSSISSNNLTFFGNYPNPATSYTNIKFSLLKQDNITLQIMDMKGRVINSLSQPNLGAGTHIIPVNTSNMPAGDYIYLIRTASGDGMAGKMTVL